MAEMIQHLLATCNLPVTQRHAVYPGIEPSKFRDALKDKVVFITGASRGIGQATAIAFAFAGASVFMAARKAETLEATKEDILRTRPEAKIGYHVMDVSKPDDVKAAVEACIETFGRLDVVISNSGAAGAAEPMATLVHGNPNDWWWTWEVNVRGTYNVAHYTLPYLAKTEGRIIFVSSIGGQFVFPGMSGYQTSKHAINRLTEYVPLENPTVKAFSFHPGGIKTAMTEGVPEIPGFPTDNILLPAYTMVRLAIGKEDYLSGRYMSTNWDLDELYDQWREVIIQDHDALKSRLSMPRK